MINRYGMIPLAFALFVFVIFFTTLVPSTHKTCIDNNMDILDNLDLEKYSEEEINILGKSIGTGCKQDHSFKLTATTSLL
tara:strand:+ start:356 stop:595 length:240 start_codon:yes stop_codon:yes gene_type:complete